MILLVSYIIGTIYFVTIFLTLGIQTAGNTPMSSNTSGMNEETGFLNDFWNDVAVVVSAAGSAATVGTLLFLWKQSRIAQKEVTTTLRPWISPSKVKYIKPEKVEVTLKNYGRLPAKVYGPSQYLIANDEIKAKDLKQLDKGKKDYVFLLLPDDEKIHNIKFDENDQKITSVKPWYLGFVLYYSYANNLEGEYGMILKWQDDSEEYEIMNEFADGMEKSKGLKEKLSKVKYKK